MNAVLATVEADPSPQRRLALAGATLFGISTAFPIVASVSMRDDPPLWVGVLDVVLAFAVVLTGALIVARSRRTMERAVLEASCRVYRAGANTLLVLLVAFFVAGHRIDWNVLLPGLAWRGWLFAYVLPAAIAAWGCRTTRADATGEEDR